MKTYKIDVNLSTDQEQFLKKSYGILRFVYNEYIRINEILYEQYQLGNSSIKWMSGYSFSKYLNNVLIPVNKWEWIKEAPSKSVKQSIMNAEKAFRKFWKMKYGFPNFKRKGQPVGLYLPKNGSKEFTQIHRHAIKVPVLGWIHFKECGYLPLDAKITGATITYYGKTYSISFTVDENVSEKTNLRTDGEVLGIDLGLETLATISDGRKYKPFRKRKDIKRLHKKLKKQQRKQSRQILAQKNNKEKAISKNRLKTICSIRKISASIKKKSDGYIEYITGALVRTKPSTIVIEDLNIRGMIKNRYLSKAISQSSFYSFRIKLGEKCAKNGILLVAADRFYPSSKTCSCCGKIKSDLKLANRVYECSHCGLSMDRDLNAAINLKQLVP